MKGGNTDLGHKGTQIQAVSQGGCGRGNAHATDAGQANYPLPCPDREMDAFKRCKVQRRGSQGCCMDHPCPRRHAQLPMVKRNGKTREQRGSTQPRSWERAKGRSTYVPSLEFIKSIVPLYLRRASVDISQRQQQDPKAIAHLVAPGFPFNKWARTVRGNNECHVPECCIGVQQARFSSGQSLC